MFDLITALVIFAIAMIAYVVCEMVKWCIRNAPVWVSWIVLLVIALVLLLIGLVA